MEPIDTDYGQGTSELTDVSTRASQTVNGGYVLMTAAYNEEAYIEQTISAVLSQTMLPKRWVVVSDGSTDGTDDIIQSYVKKHDFIRFLRISRAPGRTFSSKVIALQSGSELLGDVPFKFIGNLDADVSIGPTYFEDLISHFENDPRLGLAAGFVYEESAGAFRSRDKNRIYSVAHAAQLVRRECYEAIGGYAVLEYGGEDWHAQTSARMKGWEAVAFPEHKIFHHRHTGTGDNLIRHTFRQGRMDYAFGSSPSFEFIKCVRHFRAKPLIVGSFARFFGFLWSYACRDSRPVSREFVAFLRNEQKEKLAEMMNRIIHPQVD